MLELLTNRFDCTMEPLNLSATMASGQTFRWRKDGLGIWWGTVNESAMAVYQEGGDPHSTVYWQTFPEPDQESLFFNFFRLDVPLNQLYAEWTSLNPSIEAAIDVFRGLRILRQPSVECFFSFQCASCNTVIKIERTVHKLAQRYGAEIHLPNEISSDIRLFRYPTISELASADERALREDLWGYRAPRVINLAKHLESKDSNWLEYLRSASYAEAHSKLQALHGIGPKVADCICLFSLDKDDAVPIDTHTWQIGLRLFEEVTTTQSLTAKAYSALADAYRRAFGNYAGWAQQYLFFAELRRSKDYSLGTK